MAVAGFTPWTARPGLLSAACACGRTVTMAAATLVRRTGVEFAETMDHRGIPVEVEDYELASARLQWARATTCLDMPAQREALDWHIARRDAAYAVMRGSEAVEETP